jgi:hypothetical protein
MGPGLGYRLRRGDLTPVFHPGAPAVAGDARVGRHDVQPAELADAVIDGGFDGSIVAYVGLGRDDPAVQRLDSLDGLREIVRCRHRLGHRVNLAAQVDGDDVRAFLREPDRVAAALAACRAGDECDFAFYSSRHRCLLARSWMVLLGQRPDIGGGVGRRRHRTSGYSNEYIVKLYR